MSHYYDKTPPLVPVYWVVNFWVVFLSVGLWCMAQDLQYHVLIQWCMALKSADGGGISIVDMVIFPLILNYPFEHRY